MAKLRVERIGGLAGFGGAASHVRSRGEVDTETLSAEERQAVEALFKAHGKDKTSQVRDGFIYRIARNIPGGQQIIEVAEGDVPAALVQCVKDEIV